MPILALLAALIASPAFAHGTDAVAPGGLWAAWHADPVLSLLVGGVVLAYIRGLYRLWGRAGRSRGVSFAEAGAFAAGMAVLAAALLSPLEALTGTLLTAHMVQHVLLIAVAPPLILLGRPDAVLVFSLPASMRQGLSQSPLLRSAGVGLRTLARPLSAAFIHAVAIWVWHAPGPFQAALENRAVHDLEHASFLVTALLFWQGMLMALRSPSFLLTGILATVITLIQGGFLGALITLTGRPLYPDYANSGLWGLTALEDQQLAGLIMWVPAGAIYLLAGLVLAARLIGSEEPGKGPLRDKEPSASGQLPYLGETEH